MDLRNRFLRLAGSEDLERTTAALDAVGRRLGRLFLTQLILNATFGAVIGLGLAAIGVPSGPGLRSPHRGCLRDEVPSVRRSSARAAVFGRDALACSRWEALMVSVPLQAGTSRSSVPLSNVAFLDDCISVSSSSVTTLKRARLAAPNWVEMAVSAASRPRAMTIRPIRG